MPSNQPRTPEEVSNLLKVMLEEGEHIVENLQTDLQKKKEKLSADDPNKEFRVSDIVDDNGYQYVNLVQEGGGVLGIALLGYTYVLERMGIRFLKLAGTSAGAINASMMASLRPKSSQTLKSPIILYYLASKNLFDLVDGHSIARWLVKRQIGYKDFFQCLLNSILYILVTSLGLILLGSLLLWEGEGTSIIGLALGIIITFLLAIIAFGRGRISDGAITEFLSSSFFLKNTLIVFGLLALTYGLSNIDPTHDLRSLFGLIPLGILFCYTLWLAFRSTHLRFIQLIVATILFFVLQNGILDSQHLQWDIYPPFIVEDLTARSPYRYISIAGISLLIFLLLVVGSLAFFLWVRFHGSCFGINPGKNFHHWIKDLMENGEVHAHGNDPNRPLDIQLANGKAISIHNPKNKISNLADLEQKLGEIPPLHYDPAPTSAYRCSEGNVLAGLDSYDPDCDEEPPLALVTTEINTENKVVFPKMWKLFYRDKNQVTPADFVRSSMAVPVFFEPFRIDKDIPSRVERQEEWDKYLRYQGELKEAMFIDGGSLSNFPFNVFNPTKVSVPRLPNFGARLQDTKPAEARSVQTLPGIMGSIIHTMRSYYDKDYLITHPHYEECLTYIDVQGIDWLNFNLPVDQQKELFKRGAQAAAKFLIEFNWELMKSKQVAINAGASPAKVRAAMTIDQVDALRLAVEIKRGVVHHV